MWNPASITYLLCFLMSWTVTQLWLKCVFHQEQQGSPSLNCCRRMMSLLLMCITNVLLMSHCLTVVRAFLSTVLGMQAWKRCHKEIQCSLIVTDHEQISFQNDAEGVQVQLDFTPCVVSISGIGFRNANSLPNFAGDHSPSCQGQDPPQSQKTVRGMACKLCSSIFLFVKLDIN